MIEKLKLGNLFKNITFYFCAFLKKILTCTYVSNLANYFLLSKYCKNKPWLSNIDNIDNIAAAGGRVRIATKMTYVLVLRLQPKKIAAPGP